MLPSTARGERESDRQAESGLTLDSRIDLPLVYNGDIYLIEAAEDEGKN